MNEDTYGAAEELGAQAQGRIVVGVDGSDESQTALRWAAAVAERTGALLDVVTVWTFPVTYAWDRSGTYDVDWQGEAEKAVVGMVDKVFGPHRPVGLRTYALEGDPTQRLIEHAAGSQLLVLGSRGRGGFKGLLLGSVTNKCAAHAACPVLIVHADDAAPTVK